MNTTFPYVVETPIGPSAGQGLSNVQLGTAIAALLGLTAYANSPSRVDKRAPEFVNDTNWWFGALNFYAKPWVWWQTAIKQSRTGQFSFRVGKHHVIGVSGEPARKMFMDQHDDKFDFSSPQVLRPLGPFFMPPVPQIFQPGFDKGRSYFMRRIMQLQKTDRLQKYLGRMTGDCRKIFAALPQQHPEGFTNPHKPAWRTVFSQTCRLIYMDEIADDSKQLDRYQDIVEVFMTTFSIFNVPWPWLPAPSALRRRKAKRDLAKLVQGRIDERYSNPSSRRDDGLQFLVDGGDSKDLILDFYLGGLFIVSANPRMLTGQMLNIMATRPDWQKKIYEEIETAANTHSTNKSADASLPDKLDGLPLTAWETAFPTIQLCYTEAIRMWVAFHMARQNISKDHIAIPGTDQTIPPGSYVTLNTMEVHFNPDLYQNPHKYDPQRWLDDNDHSRDQTYGCEFCPYLNLPSSHSISSEVRLTIVSLATSRRMGCRRAPVPRHAVGEAAAEHHAGVRAGHV